MADDFPYIPSASEQEALNDLLREEQPVTPSPAPARRQGQHGLQAVGAGGSLRTERAVPVSAAAGSGDEARSDLPPRLPRPATDLIAKARRDRWWKSFCSCYGRPPNTPQEIDAYADQQEAGAKSGT